MSMVKRSFIDTVIGAVMCAVICLGLVPDGSLYAKELPQPLPEADQSGQRFITIDFDNVDIQLFIKYISELTGKNFVVDKAVQGNVTILSPTKISEEEAYKVFESVLEVHGFTTVESGSVIKILPSARARSQNVEMLNTGESKNPQDKVVTQLVRLKYASPDEMKKVLAPLVSQTSVLISHAPSGMLIITETMSNIQKLLSIIKVLDVESREEEVAFIRLENSSAEAVAKILTTVYQKSSGAQQGGAARSFGEAVKVVPYERVNALIVLASGSEMSRVKSLIATLDKKGERAEGNIRVYYLQNANAVDMAKVLNDLPETMAKGGTGTVQGKAAAISKDVRVMADEETNSLIIRATKDEYVVLEDVIKQLDIPRRMVYLEALIMEVDADKSFEVGVEWTADGTFSGGTGQLLSGFSGSDGFTNLVDSDGNTALSAGSGLTLGILKQGVRIGNVTFANLGAVIKAYKSDSDVNVISTPQILTMDNKKAEISVGENVPFITSQNTTASLQDYTQYEYKDVATKLSITPHINQSNVLRLEIETEVVRAKDTTATPTTFKRTATTTVILNDKSTIVIGGIIGHDASDSNYKVPILGDIPGLGWLFRTHTTSSKKTNMFIFITPRIVRNPAEMAAVSLKKEDEMGKVLPAVQQELHKEENLEHAMSLTRMGYEKLRSGDTAAAKEFFTEALVIDSTNPFALMNMGVVYEKEGQPKKALEMYQAVASGSSDAVANSSSEPDKKPVPLKTLAQENIDRILRTK
ncbi:type II secretion system secretin GspD [Desulfopila sp. IMCC35006]|uniref:type II secretion system secretin GspD n=1 Tax=Desulfopila sp. IMCC35006 TaxID=2569542 RepID=UPI00142EEB28|nr:type II secretion system secretin GspD [Desulfopila sp. IMCC35006]